MIVPWDTLEERIADRILALMPNSFRAVAPVANAEAMRRALNQYPVCYVKFGGEEYGESLTFSNVTSTGEQRWEIFVIARGMRGPGEARKGPGGSYDLAADVRTVLEGFDPIENTADDSAGHPMRMRSATPSEDLESDQAKYSMVMLFVNECENN